MPFWIPRYRRPMASHFAPRDREKTRVRVSTQGIPITLPDDARLLMEPLSRSESRWRFQPFLVTGKLTIRKNSDLSSSPRIPGQTICGSLSSPKKRDANSLDWIFLLLKPRLPLFFSQVPMRHKLPTANGIQGGFRVLP